MVKILFVCHGNICRSPMAEFVMKDLVKKAHLEDSFYIESAASMLLDYTDHPRSVSDPWYTDDFDTTWDDVLEGCTCLLDHIRRQGRF